jgi:hypothetical protein
MRRQGVNLTLLLLINFNLGCTHMNSRFPATQLDDQTISLGKYLYKKSNDQDFVDQFFSIVNIHRNQDPFLGGAGPNVSTFNLHEMTFAFMINETTDTVDLAIFNWKGPIFNDLIYDTQLSRLYGSNVYLFRKVKNKLLATQGVGGNELSNFSYLMGADYFTATYNKMGAQGNQPPDDFKPQPDYMDKSHPLRVALATNSLVLLSPSRKYVLASFGPSANDAIVGQIMAPLGGFVFSYLLMMVHESYHVKEGIDLANGNKEVSLVDTNFQKVTEQLQQPSVAKLVMIYTKIIFILSQNLSDKKINSSEMRNLADLKFIINALKKYPDVLEFISEYEYVEGYAEYVAADSLTKARVISLNKLLKFEQVTSLNNLTYRTGAIGGLYLNYKLNRFPFSASKRPKFSTWEIIVSLSKPPQVSTSLKEIDEKYSKLITLDENEELRRLLDYTSFRQ